MSMIPEPSIVNNRTYWIVDTFDMSCTAGGLVSNYISGLGLVTVAIRAWYPRII
jgi:hypothetical protein